MSKKDKGRRKKKAAGLAPTHTPAPGPSLKLKVAVHVEFTMQGVEAVPEGMEDRCRKMLADAFIPYVLERGRINTEGTDIEVHSLGFEPVVRLIEVAPEGDDDAANLPPAAEAG